MPGSVMSTLRAPSSPPLGQQHGVEIQPRRFVFQAVADAAVVAVGREVGREHGEPAAKCGERIVDHQHALKQARVGVQAARILGHQRVLHEHGLDVFDARLGQMPGLKLPAVGARCAMLGEHPLEKRHRAERQQRDDDQRQHQDAGSATGMGSICRRVIFRAGDTA